MVALDPNNLRTWYAEGLEDLRYKYTLQPGDLVLDIGAYEGSWSQRMINEHGVRAICVEPTSAIDGFAQGQVIKAAAGTEKGILKMSNQAFASSIYGDDLIKYPCIDIAELVKSLDNIKVCKVNIEGAEYLVIDHLIETGAIDNIGNLQVQFHTIQGQPYEQWYNALAEKLSKTHQLSWQYKFVWENWENIKS